MKMIRQYQIQLIVLFALLWIFIYSKINAPTEMSYWDFLTYKYVLNIVVAGLGLVIGYGIKNYYVTIAGATFALLIYCFAFMFDSKEVFTAFFLAVYTVFMGFATVSNLARHFKDWVLKENYL